MTVKDLMQHATACLLTHYPPDEAQAMSRLLISAVRGDSNSSLSVIPNEKATADQVTHIEGWLDLLLQSVPLQYVLHEAWFCGLKFFVDQRVLIPRPETEELVEWIISDMKFPLADSTILDIGTGSGCIPISLKRRLGKPDVYGCDISEDALEVARINAKQVGVQVGFFHFDVLGETKPDLPPLDILVSNPPYIPAGETVQMAAHVKDHEPSLALFVPDADPQLFYKKIAALAPQVLRPGARIYLELHQDHGAATADHYRQAGFEVELRKDMSGNQRMLKAWLQ